MPNSLVSGVVIDMVDDIYCDDMVCCLCNGMRWFLSPGFVCAGLEK